MAGNRYIRRSATLCTLGAVVAGCHPSAHVRPMDQGKLAARRELTATNFDNALLYKPREPPIAGSEFDLAPLLMVELERPGPRGNKREYEAARPVVYWTTSTVSGPTSDYDQVTYLWTCPHLEPLGDVDHRTVRWVRMTLGHDGFPLIWELGKDDDAENLLFVSRSFEKEARGEFGEVLPGRKYAAEPRTDGNPGTAVLGVVEDGPIPMGSYFYVTGGRCQVAEVLCRCSSAQVNRVVDSIYYDLEPLGAESDLLPPPTELARKLRWPGQL